MSTTGGGPRDGGDFPDDGVSRIKTATFTFVNVVDGNEHDSRLTLFKPYI